MKSSERLKIIIDSNIFIYLEDHGSSTSGKTSLAARFARLAARNGATLALCEATKIDLVRAKEPLRAKRLQQIEKYEILASPYVQQSLGPDSGYREPLNPNDYCDLQILGSLASGAADWLVTEDNALRSHASKSGFIDRCLSLQDAIEVLQSLLSEPSALPDVLTLKGYQINPSAPIFSSIEADYSDFRSWWLSRVCRDDRDIIILGSAKNPQGVSVTKIEEDGAHGIQGRTLKICTFKIAEDCRSIRLGELLLKATIDYARRNGCYSGYVEILPKNSDLTDWLSAFGFSALENQTTKRGENILFKSLIPTDSRDTDSPLVHNLLYGPGSLRLWNPLIVPIQPQWRRRLLPECNRTREPSQLPLLSQESPCGNAIRKAYLCNAPIRHINAGQTLLFYESGVRQAVVGVGVVESTIVSSNPEELIGAVGNRTAYSKSEIIHLCQNPVLAVLFRFDRPIDPEWDLSSLVAMDVITSHPQSIQRARKEGEQWIRDQLNWP